MQANTHVDDVEETLSITSPSELLHSFEEEEDTLEWINNVLDRSLDTGTYDLSEVEKGVSQLSATVELICEDTTSQLERTIDEISRTVPRLSFDFQFMRENVLSLQNSLHAVETQSRSTVGSQDTLNVLDRLHYLDTVKRNMTALLAVLKEAESWSSLEAEVTSLLAEHAYTRAAARLAEASKSLGVFQNTANYESRKSLLISLQNQLEASLSSALVAAISSGDVELCRKYFDIFRHIDRESEFRSYWNGSKRKALVAVWEGTALRDCGEHATSEQQVPSDRKFTAFLVDFFDELLILTETEKISITKVFPDPQVTLSTFIGTTLSALHPSLGQRVGSLAMSYDNLALPELILAYKTTQDFAVSMEKIMEKLGYSERSPLQSAVALDDQDAVSLGRRSHSRRRSQRLSFSRRLGQKNLSTSNFGTFGSLDYSWGEVLFEPFVDLQCDYSRLEKRFMGEKLRQAKLASGSTVHGARMLRERAVDLFAILDESLTRCISFTHGFGAVGLVQAVDDVVATFFESSRIELLDFANMTGTEPTDNAIGNDFAELDYSAEDYSAFQVMLHILEAVRAISERLAVFTTKLRMQLVQTASVLRNTRNDPQGFYLSGTIKPAIDLLQMSALNNVELQSLLDNVDPDTSNSSMQTPTTPNLATLFSGNRTQNYDSMLIQGAHSAVSSFTEACQLKLQETILTPLTRHLDSYSNLPAWAVGDASNTPRATPGGAISDIAIPRFSMSPSQSIQRVAEGLLNMPRLFEVYADDNALSFSISTLPHIDLDAFQRSYFDNSESLNPDINKDSRNRTRHLASPSLTFKTLSPPMSSRSLAPEAVSSAWLASLTMSLLSYLTSTILPRIRFLSAEGAAQLAEDLGYLSHIVKALNVEWRSLERWKDYVLLSEAEGREKLAVAENDGDVDATTTLVMIGKMKGWSL